MPPDCRHHSDPYASHYAGGGYDSRGYAADPYAGYGGGGDRYAADYGRGGSYERPDDRYRGAGGPDRGRYPPPRSAAPYERPDARRDIRR